MEALKTSIRENFPTDRNEQLYMYDKFGKLLFRDKWEEYRFIDTTTAKESKYFVGIVLYMRNSRVTKSQMSEIVNFVFQESVKRLTGDNSSVTSYM